MRPFYIVAEIEGRKTPLTGGPQRKDGKANVYVLVRDNGESICAYEIKCYSKDGKLKVDVVNNNGDIVDSTETTY